MSLLNLALKFGSVVFFPNISEQKHYHLALVPMVAPSSHLPNFLPSSEPRERRNTSILRPKATGDMSCLRPQVTCIEMVVFETNKRCGPVSFCVYEPFDHPLFRWRPLFRSCLWFHLGQRAVGGSYYLDLSGVSNPNSMKAQKWPFKSIHFPFTLSGNSM